MTTPLEVYRLIPLTQGQFAKISPHRFEDVSRMKWYALWDKTIQGFYAIRNHRLPNGKATAMKMHRYILGLDYGNKRQADHINHDTLDNRDENLRIADLMQQSHNHRMVKTNKTGYIGVSIFPPTKKCDKTYYRSTIAYYGKRVSLGIFPFTDEGLIQAAKAYDAAAIEFRGEFAYLNFPQRDTETN